MNKWGIPDWLEMEVRVRDVSCVYCGVKMLEKAIKGVPRKTVATWEHILNDASIVTRENIALCCASCNSSKGAKLLSDWIQSPFCKKKGIDAGTVADIVKEALRANP